MASRLARSVRILVLVSVLLTSILPAASAYAAPLDAPGDPRYFSETGFRISDDAFWDYFQKRGGIRTFGYPVSRKFQFMGFPVQFFQRRILQLQPDGKVTQLNFLDEGLMSYTVMNGATFPKADPNLIKTSPAPGSASYDVAVLSWIKANAPETFAGLSVKFYTTFINTVSFREAFPDGRGNPALIPGIDLEMWGIPTSAPAQDPKNGNFVYQRFQRGTMHYDKATGLTQGLLLADYFKAIITGQNLPADLEAQARNSRFYRQYNNGAATGVAQPDLLPGTNMKDAFEKDTPQASVPSTPGTTPAPDTASFRYGIQPHMIQVDRGPILRATRDLGFGWVKQQIEWKLWEQSQGAINWGEMDSIVNDARAHSVTVLFSIVGAPGWAREPGYNAGVAGPPQNPQTYANFVGKVASRYCGKGLGAIEVWNEQNLHYEWGNKTISPADYMNLLKPAHASIKAACPSMIVVAGALTPTGAPAPLAMDDFAYLEGMYQNGLKSYSDAVGMHPSGFNVPPSLNHTQACQYVQQTNSSFRGPCDAVHHSWSFRSTVDGYRAIMVKHGDSGKKLWATEFGWAAGGAYHPDYGYANDNTLDEQAAWTVEAYQYMRNSGFVGAAFLWNLNFRVVADRTEKAQWGVVANDWKPLPIYNSLKSMGK